MKNLFILLFFPIHLFSQVFLNNGQFKIYEDSLVINNLLTPKLTINNLIYLEKTKILSNNTSTPILKIECLSDSAFAIETVTSLFVDATDGGQMYIASDKIGASIYNGVLTTDLPTLNFSNGVLSSGTLSGSYNISYLDGWFTLNVTYNSSLTDPILKLKMYYMLGSDGIVILQ